MTNIQQPNTPGPNGADPTVENQSAAEEKIAGGTQSPQKHGPGPMQDDDMQHKRGGGDVERDIPEDDEGGARQGGRSQPDMDEEETGGRSRPGPGRSRNT